MKLRKYGNTKVEVNGEKFDSQKEYRVYLSLLQRLKDGEITALQRQVTYNFPAINGDVVRYHKSKRALKYIADFVYIEKGQKVVADAKGFRTREYKIKAALMYSLLGITIKEY